MFNRREPDKDKVFREAMAFLVSYSANRKESNPLEVRYNIARAFHYLGMNTHAQELYQQILQDTEDEKAAGFNGQRGGKERKEMQTRARFNLS